MCGRLKNFVNLTEVKSKTEDAMNIEEFREYCLSLPGVTEKMPFTALNDAYSRDVLCFYVGSKWFCYVNIVLFDRCCVKSTPEEAAELRARYEGVRPAWHMKADVERRLFRQRRIRRTRLSAGGELLPAGTRFSSGEGTRNVVVRSAAKRIVSAGIRNIPVAFAYICLRDIPMRNVRGVFDRRKRCLPAAGKRLLKTKHKTR